MKVQIRHKPMSKQRLNLYLDFYPAIPHPETGKPTRREFLGLYLYSDLQKEDEFYIGTNGKPQKRTITKANRKGYPQKVDLTPEQKAHNKETMALAENIKAKRQLLIQAENYGFLKKNDGKSNFVEYFHRFVIKHQDDKSAAAWQSAYNHLKAFVGETYPMDKLKDLADHFREHMLTVKSNRGTALTQNSASTYFTRFKFVLKEAFKAGLLDTDISAGVKTITTDKETHREYLSMEELQKLAKIDCTMPVIKQAALFSALTGLRYSDISKMVWGEVRHSKSEGNYLQFNQQKTGGAEVLPISGQAFDLLGERGGATEKVFKKLNYSDRANMHLKNWVLKAGITKAITFHSFRHTFATLQLTLGTDIYTVSKMLGHREVKTTQIYAKVINKSKRDAADRIKLDF